MSLSLDATEMRERLRRARLYLLFTPELCGAREALGVLDAVLPWIDVVQVRPKAPDAGLEPGRAAPRALATTSARELYDWTARVLERVASGPSSEVLVIANDRVDVARSLLERGCAGVHLGQDDAPPRVARDVLGPRPLIGLSTHSQAQVARTDELPVDYLGFGPIHATRTKGYATGLGPEAAWVAQQGTALPLFPIGGISLENAGELAPLGRAAVGSAVLGAEDPARAARELRELLLGDY